LARLIREPFPLVNASGLAGANRPFCSPILAMPRLENLPLQPILFAV